MTNNKNKKGFTLVELLVVVILIGVLAAIALPVYQKYVLKSRAGEALNLLEMVKVRQNVTVAKSQTRNYISQAAALRPLTSGATEVPSGADLIVNSDYTITLNDTDQCAIVIYKPDNQEKFRFAASYTEPGVGCSGSICSSFTSVTTDVASICRLPNETLNTCTRPVEPCGLGYQWSNAACDCVECSPCPMGYSYGPNCMCVPPGCQVRECASGYHFDPTPEICDCVSDSCEEPPCSCEECPSNKVRVPTAEDPCNCECPSNLPTWDANTQLCVPSCDKTCEGDEVLNITTCSCACPLNKPISGANHTCKACGDVCGSSVVLSWNGSNCVGVCPKGLVWSAADNDCVSCYTLYGEERPLWVSGGKPGSGNSAGKVNGKITSTTDTLCQVSSDGSCEPCPAEAPIWDGSKCIPCCKVKSATLTSKYGIGAVWDGQKCVPCWEADPTKPELVMSGDTCECKSCAEAHPARVQCNASNGGNGTVKDKEQVESMQQSYTNSSSAYITSSPIRFNDFLTAYNSNIDTYAYKSGALLADQVHNPGQGCESCLCGMASCPGCSYVTPNVTIPQCTTSTDTVSCECIAGEGDCGFTHQDYIVGLSVPPGQTLRRCFCDTSYNFLCPPNCIPQQTVNYTMANGDYTCTPHWQVPSDTQQGNCASTWHGAAVYEPAMPVWNATKHKCEPCGEVEVSPCPGVDSMGINQTKGFLYTTSYYWNGNTSGNRAAACEQVPWNSSNGLKVLEGVNLPYCFIGGEHQLLQVTCSPSNADSVCHSVNWDWQNYQSHNLSDDVLYYFGLSFAMSAGAGTGIQHSPYNKAYYALTELNISPALINLVQTD